jgi:hypothetical protein
VKLPRVPVSNNIPGEEAPLFRNLWKHIGKKMPKKGRGKSGSLSIADIPPLLQTALDALYGHYKQTFELWQKEGISVPPCFIVVCNNTTCSSASHCVTFVYSRHPSITIWLKLFCISEWSILLRHFELAD